MTEQPEELWTAAEVSARTKLAKSTIYEGVRDGVIPHLRIGHAIRFRPSDVKAWLDRHVKPGRSREIPDGESEA
jgi:excisionase family DNA binding protein